MAKLLCQKKHYSYNNVLKNKLLDLCQCSTCQHKCSKHDLHEQEQKISTTSLKNSTYASACFSNQGNTNQSPNQMIFLSYTRISALIIFPKSSEQKYIVQLCTRYILHNTRGSREVSTIEVHILISPNSIFTEDNYTINFHCCVNSLQDVPLNRLLHRTENRQELFCTVLLNKVGRGI